MNRANRSQRHLLGAWSLVGLAVLLSCKSSGTRTSVQERPALAGLTLALETDKPGVVLGEPVYLTARLENSGPTSVKVPPELDPRFRWLSVNVAFAKGRAFPFVPITILESDRPLQDLRPEEELAATFAVFFGGHGWSFSEPGLYTLSAKYRFPVAGERTIQIVESSSITIDVIQGPTKAGSFLVDQGAASKEAGKFLLWQSGDHLRKGIAHLENLMDRYPESPLVDYIRLALARNLSRPFKDYSVSRTRPATPAAALEHLKQVRSERMPRYLKVQKHLAEATCYAGLKNPESARQALDSARKLAGERAELGPLLKRIEDIERSLR